MVLDINGPHFRARVTFRPSLSSMPTQRKPSVYGPETAVTWIAR